jgi:hypothetical protein
MRQDELHEVLTRAQEIDAGKGQTIEGNPEYDGLMQAAEEVGINRDSVLQALRERIGVKQEPFEPGEVVFARVPDGSYYPGTVIEEKDGMVNVDFLSGSKGEVPVTAVKKFQALPTQPIECQWKFLGWRPSIILKYDPKDQMAKVAGPMGRTQWCVLHELRMAADADSAEQASPKTNWLVLAAIALGSGLLGSLLMWLVVH